MGTTMFSMGKWVCGLGAAALVSGAALGLSSVPAAYAAEEEAAGAPVAILADAAVDGETADDVANASVSAADAAQAAGPAKPAEPQAPATSPAESQAPASTKPAEPQAPAPEEPKPAPVPTATKAGWLQVADGSWYYFSKAGAAPSTGWVKLKGTWYYLDPADHGRMKTGLFNDGKANYICASSGAMRANGWVKLGSNWYYANASGALKTGWVKSSGTWYWLLPSEQGRMAASQWITDKGKRYYLFGSGAMATGWIKLGSDWYYANASGAAKTGWVKSSGKWYYLDPADEGRMLASTSRTINGALYAFNASGAMRANAVVGLGDGKVGYAASSGAISPLGEKRDDALVLTDAQDNPVTGWRQVGGAWFYGDKGGVAHTGWLKLGKTWYWMDANGVMATGLRTVDGKKYIFRDSGAWIDVPASRTAVLARAYEELQKCTTSSMTKEQKLWAAYKHIRDDFVECNPRVPHMKSNGWEIIYADDVFVDRRGNCLSYAAALAFMAKVIGYDRIYACNFGHAWVEIDGLVFDPEWEKNHRSENYFQRPINAPGGPGYTDQCPPGSPWMRVKI